MHTYADQAFLLMIQVPALNFPKLILINICRITGWYFKRFNAELKKRRFFVSFRVNKHGNYTFFLCFTKHSFIP
jgi:hypothetical protein